MHTHIYARLVKWALFLCCFFGVWISLYVTVIKHIISVNAEGKEKMQEANNTHSWTYTCIHQYGLEKKKKYACTQRDTQRGKNHRGNEHISQ